jgi:arginine/lysine/ornithine decarboxylase
MVILAVREGEAVELLKEVRADRGTIGISFEIWKKGSWDKVNGTERWDIQANYPIEAPNLDSCQVTI